MKRTGTCERVWQAEAIEDGRLDGPERLSFEKHARSCSACAMELAALVQLRETVQRTPALSSTPLAHRRLRADLLRRANARAVQRSGVMWSRRFMWFAAAVSLGAIAAIIHPLLGRLHQASSSTNLELGPPSFEVDDIDGAEWSSETIGSAIHARLALGTASFHVQHGRPGQRFLLQMPDGQIEVHGTRFRVEVRSGVTSRVEVSEGVVTLRLRDQPERLLRAGEAWDAASAREAEAAGGPIAFDTAGESATLLLDENDASTPADRSGAGSVPSSRPHAAAHDTFAAAVTAFRNGNYRKAERMLDRFLEESPRDARIEDAWFMKAVARSRSGDTEGAAELAQTYLFRFPRGLRRLEAEKLAAGSPKR
jgi:hypothetical protein